VSAIEHGIGDTEMGSVIAFPGVMADQAGQQIQGAKGTQHSAAWREEDG
jgi:hypothetical protein